MPAKVERRSSVLAAQHTVAIAIAQSSAAQGPLTLVRVKARIVSVKRVHIDATIVVASTVLSVGMMDDSCNAQTWVLGAAI